MLEGELYEQIDNTVVEYALNRSASPTLVAKYQLHLPDKKILEKS